MNKLRNTLFIAFIALVTLGDNAALSEVPFKVPLQTRKEWNFEKEGVQFSNNFSGARLNNCTHLQDNIYVATISPENSPINRSPWYAFKISSSKKQTIEVRFLLTYPGVTSRPKISIDGKEWKALEKDKWTAANPEKKTPASALIEVGPEALWIFAHPPISLNDLDSWSNNLAKSPSTKITSIGKSLEGMPIKQLTLGNPDATNFVFILGRQHPPEVTGSVGLMSFVDTIARDSTLSKTFRHSFQTIVIPVVNPDGVEHGHWRSTLGGVDPNRDYGPFTQVETRAVRDALTSIAKLPKARVYLFLDFHSTSEDIFYTQRDEDQTFPLLFTKRWLKGIQEHFPNYAFKRDAGHNENLPTSKTWAYKTFGCAGITYEFGYNTSFEKVRNIATGAAEEMMKILVAETASR
ncbi:MAG: peptidase M14 [Planctomycetaceae bacterium]|nr:peptidase M14 [Gemmataceae bacterium]PHX62748.1 MAG: peptidase M14 [Planctomycetaceae bacterium]